MKLLPRRPKKAQRKQKRRLAKRLLGIPKEKWVRHVLSLGYPADERAHSVSTTPSTRSALPSLGRKPRREFATRERYAGATDVTGTGS